MKLEPNDTILIWWWWRIILWIFVIFKSLSIVWTCMCTCIHPMKLSTVRSLEMMYGDASGPIPPTYSASFNSRGPPATDGLTLTEQGPSVQLPPSIVRVSCVPTRVIVALCGTPSLRLLLAVAASDSLPTFMVATREPWYNSRARWSM